MRHSTKPFLSGSRKGLCHHCNVIGSVHTVTAQSTRARISIAVIQAEL